MDEVDDAHIVLVDPEHEHTRDLLREAANKVVLHYSWVNRSLNSGRPLVDTDNWGDCKVTFDNIEANFGYVQPTAPSNPQLQTPRPTPENRSHNLSTLSGFSQSPAGITPPSSRPPYTPTPSQWNRDPVMLQQQTPQLPLTNQVVSYNSQPIQSHSVFTPFPASQPADMSAIVYGQQQVWPTYHSGMYGTVQPPTPEDLRRACDIIMWFQRSSMYQHLPPPPTPTPPGPTFYPSTQRPQSAVSTRLESPTVPGAPDIATLSHHDSTDSHDTLLDLGGPSTGPPPDSPPLPTSPEVHSVHILSPPPPDNLPGQSTVPTPPHTNPKLFEHAVGKPIRFCVPIILKKRGKLAEIFRVRFELSPGVSPLTRYIQ